MSEPIDIEPREGEQFGDWLGRAIKALNPADFATAYLGRDRPYNGPKIQTVDWEALRVLSDGATPGPWRAVSLSVENDRWTVSRSDNLDPLFQGGRVRAERDAFLIAAAVNYVRVALSATMETTDHE